MKNDPVEFRKQFVEECLTVLRTVQSDLMRSQLMADRDALATRLAAVKIVCEWVEFVTGYIYCPCCKNWKSQGHKQTCPWYEGEKS